MMKILFWVANMIIIYALLVVIVTAIRKPTDIRYTFLNLFRQRRRSGVTLLAITLGGVAVFIFGGFVDYSFWRRVNKPSAPTWAYSTLSTRLPQQRGQQFAAIHHR